MRNLPFKRTAQIAVLLCAGFTMLGAGAPLSSSRFNMLGHKLMCPCGCGEILLECNHVGCPDSNRMIGELKDQMATGLGDTGVLNFFSTKYGPTVLAAPIRGGFDTVAWVVPFAVLILGIGGVLVVLRVWKQRRDAMATPEGNMLEMTPEEMALREQIRRETEYGE